MMELKYTECTKYSHTQSCSEVTHSTAVLLEMRLGEGLCIHLIIGDRRHQTLTIKSFFLQQRAVTVIVVRF